jgi:hypothetical protein
VRGNGRGGVAVDEPRLYGFDIALSGIDGVGKSTVSEALATALRERGYVVSVLSWRNYLKSGSPASGPTALRATYIAMLRSLYSAAVGADGGSVEHLLPSLEQDVLGTHDGPPVLEDPSLDLALNPDRPNAFLASGLLEIAARLVERETVIAPALARGEVVIQESHGLKNCLKLGLVAQHLANGNGEANRIVEDYISMARRCLTEWTRPSLGVLVTGDPQLAYVWRKRQKGFIARGEHLDEDGRPAEWTFVELQTRLQEKLVATAETEGWPSVTMTDRPQDLNVTSAVQTVLDALATRGILPMESMR